MGKSAEVVNIHVGQAGCEFGAACWELYCLEHGIEPDGKCDTNSSVPDSFFEKIGGLKVVPKAIFIDLEPTTMDNIRLGKFRQLFNTNNLLNGKEDAASCFGRGFLSLGNEMVGPATNRIRRVAESCGRLQGFLISRSYGGGTGSGFTARLLEELAADYPKTDNFDFSISMSPVLSSLPVEPYNNAFAMHHSLDFSCASFVFDNEACYDICSLLLEACDVRFVNINRLLAYVTSFITAPFRYAGNVNITINEMLTNLMPYPRLQYPTVSCAPLHSYRQTLIDTESAIINGCFEAPNQLIKCDVRKGTYMSNVLLLRGKVNLSCVNTALQSLQAKKYIRFVEWAPVRFKIGINNTPPPRSPAGDFASVERSCVKLSNSTHIKSIFTNIMKKFDILFSKKAFIHWYMAEGLEEWSFQDTKLDMASLIADYSELDA